MEDERGPGLDFSLCFVCGSRPWGAAAFLLCLFIWLNVFKCSPVPASFFPYISTALHWLKSRPGPLSSSNVVTPPFIPSEAPPWDSRPVSGAGVVHYHSLHRPRSVPTALGPAPLVTILLYLKRHCHKFLSKYIIFIILLLKKVISFFYFFYFLTQYIFWNGQANFRRFKMGL